eukprot:gene11527-biopygen329
MRRRRRRTGPHGMHGLQGPPGSQGPLEAHWGRRSRVREVKNLNIAAVLLVGVWRLETITLIGMHRGCFALPVALYADRDFLDTWLSFQHAGVGTPVPFVAPRFDDCGSQDKNSSFAQPEPRFFSNICQA